MSCVMIHEEIGNENGEVLDAGRALVGLLPDART